MAKQDAKILVIGFVICCITLADTANLRRVRQDLSFPDLNARRTGTSCVNNRRVKGTCVPLDQCGSLVKSYGRKPAGLSKYVRENRCSFDGSTPVVCCPTAGNSGNSKPSTPKDRVPTQSPKNKRQVECGTSSYVNTRIIGGQPAQLNAWPWMAAIYDEQFGIVAFRCGGVLINSDYILTAAHCVSDRLGLIPADKFSVRLGDLDLESDKDGAKPITLKVTKITIHSDYNTNWRQPLLHDIALMKLEKSVSFSVSISPICLPDKRYKSESFEKKRPTVIGWGRTENGTYSEVLREVPLPVVGLEKCKSTYSNVPLGSTHLCAGLPQGGKDSCQGDSGGPFMTPDGSSSPPRWMVIGIVSMGAKCAQAGFPGIYTRVTEYLNWIQSNAV